MGAALISAALADRPAGLVGGLELYELTLGLVLFPAVTVVVGLVARHHAGSPLRLTGPVGITTNLATIVVLFAIHYTAGAAALFYGTSLLVAAWRGQPHCEATIVANLILRRDDQIGCPAFTPIDAWEARSAR